MKIDLEKIIVKIKFVEEKKLKAIIGLDFGDFVIKGFRVQESQFKNIRGDNLWFTPPTYQAGGRHHPIFFMPTKELWEKLGLKVWDEYDKQSREYHKKRLGVTDEELT